MKSFIPQLVLIHIFLLSLICFYQLTNFMNDSVKIFTASTNRNLLLSPNSSNHGVTSKTMNDNFQCMSR